MKKSGFSACALLLCLFLLLGAAFPPSASAQTIDLEGIILMGAEMSAVEQISSWRDVVSLAVSSGARGDFVLGLRSDGRVYAAGLDDKGQCQVDKWQNVVKIAAGDSISLGLTSDGKVYCAGYGEKAAPDTSAWENVTDIAAGCEFVLGVDQSGRQLYSGIDEYNINIWFKADKDNKVWENKHDEQRFWSELTDIRASGENVLGRDKLGELRSFGFTPACKLPDLPDVLDFDLSLLNGAVLTTDNKAMVWGDNSYSQCEVSDEEFTALSLGGRHCLFLRPDGTVAAFGSDDCGQLQVQDWKDIVYIEAGSSCSLGINSQGRVLIAGSLGAK